MARKISIGNGQFIKQTNKKDREDTVKDLTKEMIEKNIVDKEDVNSI